MADLQHRHKHLRKATKMRQDPCLAVVASQDRPNLLVIVLQHFQQDDCEPLVHSVPALQRNMPD